MILEIIPGSEPDEATLPLESAEAAHAPRTPSSNGKHSFEKNCSNNSVKIGYLIPSSIIISLRTEERGHRIFVFKLTVS